MENRRALRLIVDIPTVVHSIGQSDLMLSSGLERIYERVAAAQEGRGQTLSGVVRDLSINGAFVAAEPLPLLSRVALGFALHDLQVEAIGWILWRRLEDCDITREGLPQTVLSRGFGVLFEAIPMDARLLIHEMVNRAPRRAR